MKGSSFRLAAAEKDSVFLLVFRSKRGVGFNRCFAESCIIGSESFAPIAPFFRGVYRAAGGFTDCRIPVVEVELPRSQYSLRQVPRMLWMEVEFEVLLSWADLLKQFEIHLPEHGFRRW